MRAGSRRAGRGVIRQEEAYSVVESANQRHCKSLLQYHDKTLKNQTVAILQRKAPILSCIICFI